MPQGLVDAYLGTDMTGKISEGRLELGSKSLSCVNSYNNRVMCGENPKTLEVDGCEWQVLGRGGPTGYSPTSAEGWFIVSASSECAGGGAPLLCETWLTGTVQ